MKSEKSEKKGIRCPFDKKEMSFWLVLFFFGLIISSVAFLPYVNYGHDLYVHIGRIYGIREGLLNGELFIKLQENWLQGYGYLIGVFYGDFLLYYPAVLNILGIPMHHCYQIFIITMNMLTLFVSYHCFKKMFKNNYIGLLGAMLYGGNVYRLIDVYLRTSVGEYCAFLFFPVIVYGFYKVFSADEQDKKNNNAWILLSVSFAGLVNTHILSCEMVAIFVLLFLLFRITQFRKIRVIEQAVTTLLSTLLLSASFVIPFLDFMMTGGTYVTDASRNDFSLNERGISLAQLFELFPNADGISRPIGESIGYEMPLNIGLGMTIALFCAIFVFSIVPGRFKEKKLILYIVLSVLSLWMATAYFPWDTLRNLPMLENAISSIQFPWRFLAPACIFVTLAFCESLVVAQKTEYRKYCVQAGIAILFLCLISSVYLMNGVAKKNTMINVNPEGQRGFMTTGGEYLPIGTDTRLLDGAYHVSNDAVQLTDYIKDGTNIEFNICTSEDVSVELPLLYYKYYRCYSDNKEFEIFGGNNNVVTVKIPGGTDERIYISYEVPVFWKISYAVTTVSCIAVAVIYLIGIFKSRRKKTVSPVKEG